MALYLTGGGEQENFNRLDKHFLKSFEKGSKLLLVPYACDDYDQALERVEDVFLGKEITSIDLLSKPNEMTWDQLNKYDGILLEGGNTFELINSIRESSFFNLIKSFFKTKRPVYADSAGAIMLGANVHTAFLGEDADHDHLRLQDYRGLDLVSPWSIHAHYTPDENDDLQDLLYEQGNPILCLPETCGVFIKDNKIINLSNEHITITTFEGLIKIDPDEEFSQSLPIKLFGPRLGQFKM